MYFVISITLFVIYIEFAIVSRLSLIEEFKNKLKDVYKDGINYALLGTWYNRTQFLYILFELYSLYRFISVTMHSTNILHFYTCILIVGCIIGSILVEFIKKNWVNINTEKSNTFSLWFILSISFISTYILVASCLIKKTIELYESWVEVENSKLGYKLYVLKMNDDTSDAETIREVIYLITHQY